MNLDEADKQLVEKEFSRISVDTWVYRKEFINTYLTINNTSVDLLFQSIGTNMVMISKKEKFQVGNFSKAVTCCVSMSDSISSEISIFVNHCVKLMGRTPYLK